MIISRSFSINGVPQWLYLNLCSRPKGTLLFLHGGPGWADAPWAGVICQRLWGKVNTIHWDQRGCNRSLIAGQGAESAIPAAPAARLTIDQLVRDGLAVCRSIGEEF